MITIEKVAETKLTTPGEIDLQKKEKVKQLFNTKHILSLHGTGVSVGQKRIGKVSKIIRDFVLNVKAYCEVTTGSYDLIFSTNDLSYLIGIMLKQFCDMIDWELLCERGNILINEKFMMILHCHIYCEG